MNALDIVILLIVAFAFYRGFRKGFLATLLGGGALIFAFLLATTSYRFVAHWLDQWLGSVEGIKNYLSQTINLTIPSAQVRLDVIPSLNMDLILKDLSLPQFYKDEMARQLQELTFAVPVNIETLSELVYHYLASSLWNGLVFVLLIITITYSAKLISRSWLRWRGEGLVGRTDQILGGLLFGSATTIVLIILLNWFYTGPLEKASPLRLETEPLRASSQLMPHIYESSEKIRNLYGGFTFNQWQEKE
ncbi:CvpA family protein [Heliorestis convoluta]|uniref:CvpA family protein n=1 Tax=Heliorestis convoluta TaxID=356322 RepID=A0A5Q2MWT6_9FIRM|nr:CvpA family protein [Heliorestis convoluta]QGG47044.1 CvpA family protein [Heliorestis convoluta]